MDKTNNLWRGCPRHHINFGPKSGHMAILERMQEISKNFTFNAENTYLTNYGQKKVQK
jgi:hypothetical protein